MDISFILRKLKMDINNKSKNEQVQKFLNDIEDFNIDKLEILNKLREVIINLFPNLNEEIKYGGIVFIVDEIFFSGLFIRKNHISLEFVHGAEMNDPDNFLEGNGKFRRHLKIKNLADIKDKNVDFFVKQSLFKRA